MDYELEKISEKNREIILNTISHNSEKYKRYLHYLNMNIENFSKSLKVDLNDFISDLKSNSNTLTSYEKEGLMFPTHRDNDGLFKFNEKSEESEELNILMDELEKMNIKYKNIRDIMHKMTEIKKIKDQNCFETEESWNYVSTNIQKILNDKKISEETRSDITNDEIKNINIFKNEISELYQKNKLLKEQKEKLENKMKSFCNLPADIKRIKEMIRQKRNEYDELDSD